MTFDEIYIRGGSWVNDACVVWAADRIWFAPSNRIHILGFRIVRNYE